MHAAIRRFSPYEYHQMAELGLFENQRVELIEGTIIEMSPQGAPHVVVLRRLNRLFTKAVDAQHDIQIQSPLALGHSEPEPDLALISRSDDLASTAELVVEVASTSLEYDKTTKATLYAQAKIPEYWIVNLVHQEIEVRTDPSPRGYKTIRCYTLEDTLTSTQAPCSIDISELLGNLPRNPT